MKSTKVKKWKGPVVRARQKENFKAEVSAWANKIGVKPRELHVRPMKNKWGSCSTAGRVSFDTELLAQPAHFRNHVIVHELLHMKVPNHGKLFKALLRAYLGKPSNAEKGAGDKLRERTKQPKKMP